MPLTVIRVRRALVGLAALSAGLGLLPLSLPYIRPSAPLPIVESLEARAAGPVISLPFNEGTGTTATDTTGNGNTGTLINGPAWTTGKTGGALSFDGSNDSVYVANSSSLNTATTGLTVSAWVYRNANQQGFVSVLSRQQGNSYYERFYLGFENGNYRWLVNTTSGYSDFTLGGAAPLGQWLHLVGTFDGTDVKLYVNGALQFSSPHSGTLPTDTTGLTIGANYNDAAHTAQEVFNGKIDEVNVYAQALTAQDVSALSQTKSGPIVSLALDEGSGTTAADSSGNGNSGTLQNGASWTSGRSGGAVSLDGVDDTVYISNAAGLTSITNGLTVAAWVYRPANQTGFASVLSREVGTSSSEHFYLGFENGRYRWFVNTSGGYSNSSLGGAAPTGQWIHMVGTYDGSNVILYVNGAQQFSTKQSGTFGSDTTGIAIGANHNSAAHLPDDPFSGKVDDVKIYSYALSAQEALQLYQSAPTSSGDSTAPTVSLSAPAAASTVSGSSVTVSATAADNVGVAGVQFKLDGANLGAEDTSAPYSITWNTTQVSGGSHSLTAVARDTSNNTTTSSPVAVTVSNPSAFDFSLSTGGAQSVVRGSSVTNTITATLASGTAQSVTYSVSGLPSGATSSVTPGSCSPTCSATRHDSDYRVDTTRDVHHHRHRNGRLGRANGHFRPDGYVVLVRDIRSRREAGPRRRDGHDGQRRFGERQQRDAAERSDVDHRQIRRGVELRWQQRHAVHRELRESEHDQHGRDVRGVGLPQQHPVRIRLGCRARGRNDVLRALLFRLREWQLSLVREHDGRVFECLDGRLVADRAVGARGGHLRRRDRQALCERGTAVLDSALGHLRHRYDRRHDRREPQRFEPRRRRGLQREG